MSAPVVIPASLKIVTSVMRRAEELDKNSEDPESRTVAYYCRLYCVTKGSKICGSDPEAGKFLIGQMDVLEKIKPTLPGTKEDAAKTCRNYALSVFNKAESEDQAGIADKTTAKIYYAAGSFFDILEQFGDVDAEIEEKRKYAKWKATDILNCIKDGTKPAIGGYGEFQTPAASSAPANEAPANLASASSFSLDIPSAPVGGPVVPIPRPPFADSPVPPPQYQQPQYQQPPPTFQHQPPSAPPQQQAYGGYNNYSAPPPPQQQQQSIQLQPPSNAYSRPGYVSPVPPSGTPVSNADPRVKDVVEICAFAMAALKHNDINLARERLTEALRRLG